MTISRHGNLFDPLPPATGAEVFETLAAARGALVRRIVSTGQATPPGAWCDQHHAEWVAVLAGAADLLLEGEAEPRRLRPGDHVLIPARHRHRVAWTAPDQPTVWLVVHLDGGQSPGEQG